MHVTRTVHCLQFARSKQLHSPCPSPVSADTRARARRTMPPSLKRIKNVHVLPQFRRCARKRSCDRILFSSYFHHSLSKSSTHAVLYQLAATTSRRSQRARSVSFPVSKTRLRRRRGRRRTPHGRRRQSLKTHRSFDSNCSAVLQNGVVHIYSPTPLSIWAVKSIQKSWRRVLSFLDACVVQPGRPAARRRSNCRGAPLAYARPQAKLGQA